MTALPQPMHELPTLFRKMHGQSFKHYGVLLNRTFYDEHKRIRFVHIQGSPGASPASVCHLTLKIKDLGLAGRALSSPPRVMAAADYMLRAFDRGVTEHARQNRGAQGSGSFQLLGLPPQVLERNLISFDAADVRIAFHVSLPGSPDNRILGRQAAEMFDIDLAGILRIFKAAVARQALLDRHCDVVEDMIYLQTHLDRYGLVAFVGDGAVLPRQSGVSQSPLKKGGIPLLTPPPLAVEVDLPNAGRTTGFGVRRGINVIIGGAFHGKSTLLDALAKGVYPHIPGDGRERVVTHPHAVGICTEEGRTVTGLDISGFIHHLPGKEDTRRFHTQNASGSTSQAAAIIEAVQAGAKLLLIDEDRSAANFLIKDRQMRKLIPNDTITPLFDRVRELHQKWGVSTLMAVGGSVDYLGVARHVVAVRNYQPVDMTAQVQHMRLSEPRPPEAPMPMADERRILPGNFDPQFYARRLGKTIAVRIKPLRLQMKILEYGNQQLDLTVISALVDPHQVLAVGYALLLAAKQFEDAALSPSELAEALHRQIAEQGLDVLIPDGAMPIFLARPRKLELAAAINRLRNLRVEFVDR